MPAEEHTNPACDIQHMYPRGTAGHRMVTNVPAVSEKVTLAQVRDEIEKHARHYCTVNYVYVLNAQKKLVGVLSIRDLFLHPGQAIVGHVCKREGLVTVQATKRTERAAYLALRHNIKALPVIDDNGILLGELSSDEVMHILYKELHEDALRMAGIRHEGGLNSNVLELSLVDSFRHRIPWLIIGLVGGLLSAKIIGLFEATLAENIILAAFLPLIVYMSSAVGTQMQAYVIRDLAVEHKFPFGKYLFRNAIIVMSIAAVLGLLLTLAVTILHDHPKAGLALGIALVISTLSSILTGLLFPFAFHKFHLDPADASGPIATIIQDMLSIVIYFGVATALL